MENEAPQPRLLWLQALLAAMLAATTAYFAIRLKGLLGGELLYNPDSAHGHGPIPYFRWVIFSAWLSVLAGAAALWFSGRPPTARQLGRRLRWAAAAMLVLSALTAAAQLVMIKHWKGRPPADAQHADDADPRRP